MNSTMTTGPLQVAVLENLGKFRSFFLVFYGFGIASVRQFMMCELAIVSERLQLRSYCSMRGSQMGSCRGWCPCPLFVSVNVPGYVFKQGNSSGGQGSQKISWQHWLTTPQRGLMASKFAIRHLPCRAANGSPRARLQTQKRRGEHSIHGSCVCIRKFLLHVIFVAFGTGEATAEWCLGQSGPKTS